MLDYIKAVEDVSVDSDLSLAICGATRERGLRDPDNMKSEFVTSGSKTDRQLGPFDCIKAPCVDECPLDQKGPAVHDCGVP